MSTYDNPFDYESASDLKEEELLEYYCEDFNYSRFVLSRRNVFFSGERGTGKTMVLLYHSVPVQQRKARAEGLDVPLEVAGVYVPCNTPLAGKMEYELLEDFPASIVSEHILVLQMIMALADALGQIPDLLVGADLERLVKAGDLVFMDGFGDGKGFLQRVHDLAMQETNHVQRALNSNDPSTAYANALSFSTGIVPLLRGLHEVPRLSGTHFTFLMDDAHMLRPLQRAALNSWVSYRDHSLFSFKIAFARSDWGSFKTASGAAILEGHDYIIVDMEQPYQNKFSGFGQLASQIVTRRLSKLKIPQPTPEAFFPENPRMRKDIDACKDRAEKEARETMGLSSRKQVNDYVYKPARAMYFRERNAQANRPPYSGFETLVHLSTGVIRYLLEPCYRMYEHERSRESEDKARVVTCISPQIQTEEIFKISRKWWDNLRDALDDTIEGCSREQAQQLYNLFEQLGVLFRERLKADISEPRATTFSISERDAECMKSLDELLHIARKAQYLYRYSSVAKSQGKREYYYVPNRLLWPDRGLDPIGQNARVSLKASDLWAAAVSGRALKQHKPVDSGRGLFDEA